MPDQSHALHLSIGLKMVLAAWLACTSALEIDIYFFETESRFTGATHWIMNRIHNDLPIIPVALACVIWSRSQNYPPALALRYTRPKVLGGRATV